MKLEVYSDKQERFIARKLSGFIQQRYAVGGSKLREELIESRIVEAMYGEILRECHESSVLPQSVRSTVVLYYSEVSETVNYH